MIKKTCCSRFSLYKFVQLKFFWTQFKNLQGPCSLRPCISRPYCNRKVRVGTFLKQIQKYIDPDEQRGFFLTDARVWCDQHPITDPCCHPCLSFFLLKEKLRSKISQRKIAFSAFCTALCIRQFTICIKVHFLYDFFKVDIWLAWQEKYNLLLVLKVGPEYCNLNWSQVCIWMSWVQVICFDSRSGESPNSFFFSAHNLWSLTF